MTRDATKSLYDFLRSQFKGSVTLLSADDTRAEVTEVIPSGIDALDRYVLGIGGFPVGRLTEIYSEEGAGKTSLGLAILSQAIKAGGIGVLVETETALQPERAEVFGVDRSRVILLQPDCLEDVLEQMGKGIEALPDSGPPSLVLWDSVAATPTRAEAEEGLIGGEAMGARARMLSRMCRSLCTLAARKRVALVFINQTRMKIGVVFGSPITTPGGEAVKFHASVRIQLWGTKHIKVGSTDIGRYVRAKAVKNKLAMPFRTVELRFDYAKGWDDDWSTLNFAKELGIMPDKSKGKAAADEARRLLEGMRWAPDGVPEKAEAKEAEGGEE